MQSITDRARQSLDTLRRNIDTQSPHDSLSLLRQYDDLHRLVYGRPAPDDIINAVILRSFRLHIQGNHAPSEAELYQAIQWRIEAHQPQFFGTPLSWQSMVLQQWYDDTRHSIGPAENTPAENMLRAHILLTSNLQAYTPDQVRYKARLRQRLQSQPLVSD